MSTDKFPDYIENAITKRHEHESKNRRPLWLIWRVQASRNIPNFPALDSVCDTEESCRYHVAAALESDNEYVWVERVPANHRFASSLDELQIRQHKKLESAQVRFWRDRAKNGERAGGSTR